MPTCGCPTTPSPADEEGRIADDVIGVLRDFAEADDMDLARAWAWNSCPFCGEGDVPRPGGCIKPKLKGELEFRSYRAEAYVEDGVLNRESEP